jgi:hypothetical protein
MRTPVSTPKLEVLDALIATDDFNPFSLESGAPQQRNEPGNSTRATFVSFDVHLYSFGSVSLRRFPRAWLVPSRLPIPHVCMCCMGKHLVVSALHIV